MPVYRITDYTSPDVAKAAEHIETLRDLLEGAGAEFIDIVQTSDGGGFVVAKYATEAAMEAATEVSKQAFGKMIEAGLINAESISGKTGEVTNSF